MQARVFLSSLLLLVFFFVFNEKSFLCYPLAVDGAWDEWTPWSLCSSTCGRGYRDRTRTCKMPKNGGEPCRGPSRQTKFCNIAVCPGEKSNFNARINVKYLIHKNISSLISPSGFCSHHQPFSLLMHTLIKLLTVIITSKNSDSSAEVVLNLTHPQIKAHVGITQKLHNCW